MNLPANYYQYSKYSYKAIAKVAVPVGAAPAGGWPVMFYHVPTTPNQVEGIDLNWEDTVVGSELLSRGVCIISYTTRPSGFYENATFSARCQDFDRAFFPESLRDVAEVVQYFRLHATDTAMFGGGTITTDPLLTAHGGEGFGAWKVLMTNLLPDGTFSYRGINVSTDDTFGFEHSHICNVLFDNTGIVSLSQFSESGYGEAGGALYDGWKKQLEGINFGDLSTNAVIRADVDHLLTATNPRVSQVFVFSNNATDPGTSPADTAISKIKYSGYTAYWDPGTTNTQYVELNYPHNQFYLHDQLDALGNSNHLMYAGGPNTNATGNQGISSDALLASTFVGFLQNVAGWNI